MLIDEILNTTVMQQAKRFVAGIEALQQRHRDDPKPARVNSKITRKDEENRREMSNKQKNQVAGLFGVKDECWSLL